MSKKQLTSMMLQGKGGGGGGGQNSFEWGWKKRTNVQMHHFSLSKI